MELPLRLLPSTSYCVLPATTLTSAWSLFSINRLLSSASCFSVYCILFTVYSVLLCLLCTVCCDIDSVHMHAHEQKLEVCITRTGAKTTSQYSLKLVLSRAAAVMMQIIFHFSLLGLVDIF